MGDARSVPVLESSNVRRFVTQLASFLVVTSAGVPYDAHGGADDLLCDTEGMAGISFGQVLERQQADLDEPAGFGTAYFAVAPSMDISPFEKLIVGVSLVTRSVFSIRLEMHGGTAELDRVIENFKVALGGAHPDVAWSVIGNHHYGERLTGLDLALYRIGDYLDGKPSFLLSYYCDSRQHIKELLKEGRRARDPENKTS